MPATTRSSTRRSPIRPPTDYTQALAIQNLGLVRPYARQYSIRTGLEFDDLQAVGYVGLVKASRIFDPSRGLRFSTIAVTYICGAIKQHVRDNGFVIKFPRSWREQSSKVRELARLKTTTTQQIAEITGLSIYEVQEILAAMHHPGALPEDSLHDQNPHKDPELIDCQQQAAHILAMDAFDRLALDDQHIILGIFGAGRRAVQTMQQLDRHIARGVGRSQPLKDAAECALLRRRAEGLRPFRRTGRTVGINDSPSQAAQRLQDRAEQLGLWPAINTAPAATPAPVDPTSVSSSASTPAPHVPPVVPQPSESSATRTRGRGRRSRRAASGTTQSTVAASSVASAKSPPILPDHDQNLDRDHAGSTETTVAAPSTDSSAASQPVMA